MLVVTEPVEVTVASTGSATAAAHKKRRDVVTNKKFLTITKIVIPPLQTISKPRHKHKSMRGIKSPFVVIVERNII